MSCSSRLGKVVKEPVLVTKGSFWGDLSAPSRSSAVTIATTSVNVALLMRNGPKMQEPLSPPMVVRNVGDGQWKTATFTIPDAAFQNRQEGGMDFCIYDGRQQNLMVRFVRIVKTVPPYATRAASAQR